MYEGILFILYIQWYLLAKASLSVAVQHKVFLLLYKLYSSTRAQLRALKVGLVVAGVDQFASCDTNIHALVFSNGSPVPSAITTKEKQEVSRLHNKD